MIMTYTTAYNTSATTTKTMKVKYRQGLGSRLWQELGMVYLIPLEKRSKRVSKQPSPSIAPPKPVTYFI